MFNETRKFPHFTGILLKGIGNVEIIPSDEHKIIMGSNQDVLKNIKTEILNDILKISVADTLPVWLVSFPKLEMQVYIKDLRYLKVSGIGKLRTEHSLIANEIYIENNGVGGIFLNITAEKTKTRLKGVGEIVLNGKTSLHDVEISGTGKINAYNYEADEVKIYATGVGECIVSAKNKLEYRAGGIGRIKYRGNPELNGTQSGLGIVQKII